MTDKLIINRHGGNIVFLSDNGGVLTELASVDGYGLTIQGNLQVLGTTTTINTEIQLADQLVITNAGTGPALDVNQTGSQPVASFKDDGTTVFNIADGGSITIGSVGFGGTHNLRGDILITSGNQISLKQQGASTIRHEIQSSGARRGYFEVEDSGDEVRFGSITNTKVGFYTNFGLKGAISAAGAWTLGSAGSSETHSINGNFISSRGDANSSRTWNIINSNVGTAASARLIVGGSNDAVQTVLESRGTAGSPAGGIVGTLTNHNLTFFTNTTSVGSVDTSGQWMLGPSSGSALVHQMQSGNLTAFQINAGGSNNIARLTLNSSGTTGITQFEMLRAGNTKWQFNNNASDTLEFSSGATGIVGTTTSAGAWTLGPAASSAISHTINGSFNINRAASTRSELNIYKNNSSRFTLAAVQGSGDVIPGTSNDDIAIRSENTHIHFSANAGATNHGSLQNTGVWTLGPTSGNATHVIRSGGNTQLRLDSVGSSLELIFNRTGASPGTNTISSSAGTMQFQTGATTAGSFNTSSDWTFKGNATFQNNTVGNFTYIRAFQLTVTASTTSNFTMPSGFTGMVILRGIGGNAQKMWAIGTDGNGVFSGGVGFAVPLGSANTMSSTTLNWVSNNTFNFTSMDSASGTAYVTLIGAQ